MSRTDKQSLLTEQLAEHIALLEQSLASLRYSEDKCRPLAGKRDYSMEEFEHWEALTARFARTVDILTQKVLKSLFMALGEDITTFLDAARYAEKLSLAGRADDLMTLRALRNAIAHEYAAESLHEIFSEVLASLPMLSAVAERVIAYARALPAG
jgi:uncharacterized protein with HEPN domain